jgi:hypothetical protein
MRTQEVRAVEGLAKLLLKLMDKSDGGTDIYNDEKCRKAMKALRTEIRNWGLE